MNRTATVLGAIVIVGLSVLGAWTSYHRRTPASARPPTREDSLPKPAPAPAGLVLSRSPAVQQVMTQLDDALRVNDHYERERIVNVLFPDLLAQDFAEAAAFAESMERGDLRERMLRRVARAWAEVDFAGAVDWIASLPEAADRQAAFEDACFAAAPERPEAAVQAWSALNLPQSEQVLDNLIQAWATTDVAAAQTWVRTQPLVPTRDHAIARIAFVLAGRSPRAAAQYVIDEMSPGPAQIEAVVSVLHQWAKQDRAAATAWVEQFPAGPLADRAREEIAGLAQYVFPAPRP